LFDKGFLMNYNGMWRRYKGISVHSTDQKKSKPKAGVAEWQTR
jgi:hypothetical protein